MNIKECLKKNGLQSEVDSFKRFQSVDIDFINADGAYDEVQFDISGAGTKTGEDVLTKLFSDFCKEDKCSEHTVTSVTVVASADTMDELYRELCKEEM